MSDEFIPYYFTWTKQKGAHSFDVHHNKPFHFVRTDGKEIIDFSSISYQCSFGLKPQFIIDRIKKQLDVLPVASPKARFSSKLSVTQKLLDLMNFGEGKIFYTVSGSESIENALKMVRQYSGRKIVLSRKKSYHGASLGAVSVSGDWRNDISFKLDEGTIRIPEPEEDPNLEFTRKIIEMIGPHKIAAICLETVTGSNGIINPTVQWWKGIQDICNEFNISLILDEVICGFGRTGKPFGFHHLPFLKPDFVCMAKAISGGVIPFGAVWTSQKIADYFDEILLNCGLTNYAHPIGLAALDAVLEFICSEEFKRDYIELEKLFKNELTSLQTHPKVESVRQVGMLGAIDLKNSTYFIKDLTEVGIYLINQNNRLILSPAINMPKEYLQEGFHKIKQLLERS